MKRVLIGILWFFVFQFCLGFIGGFFYGIAGVSAEQTQQEIHRFIPLIFVLALIFAVVGTAMGKLPGTKKK